MAERFGCPPHIQPRAIISLIGVLESTPTIGGKDTACRAELVVGSDTFSVVASGAARSQLATGRPGDVLTVDGKLRIHRNVVAGKNQPIITIEAEKVTVAWQRPTGVRA